MLVLLVLIPTVAIVAVALIRAGQSYRDASSLQLIETANMVAQSVQSELRARAHILPGAALVTLPGLAADAADELPDSGITTYRVELTPTGWRVLGAPAQDLPLEHLVETAQRRRLTVSNLIDVHRDGRTEPMVAISTPRELDQNVFEVTTVIGKPYVLVQTLTREESFANGMLLAVTDGTGRIVARSRDAHRFIGQRAPDWDSLRAVNASQGTFEARTVDGPQVIFAFREVGDTPGWMAVVGEPLALYNERWQQPLIVLFGVSLLTVLGALLVATIVARRILKPIKYLAHEARLAARSGGFESARFAAAPSIIAEFDTLRESLEQAKEQARRSRAALQSSYEALREAERVARVGNWSMDLATGKMDCSPMVYVMHGLDPSGPSLSVDDLPRLLVPESLTRMREAIRRCSEEGESYGLEVECIRHPNRTFAAYLRGEAVRDTSGKIVGLRGTIQDISEREEERRRIAALADNLPSGAIFRVEERPAGRWAVTYISAGVRDIIGISAAEIMADGATFMRAIHRDDLGQFVAAMNAARASGSQFDREFRMYGPNRAIVWIHCSAVRRQQTDGRLVWDGIARDVTGEHMAAEALRNAKEAAEAAERTKSDFLATMSHEIRTPMNTVIGMTRLALQTSLTPRQRNYLEKINISAKTLLRIINDILDLSKIEAGGLELEDTAFKLESVLDAVSAVMAMPAEEKGIEIAYSVQPGLPRRLHGDPLRLGQILTNLVGNAIKFTEHGEVIVRIEPETGPDGSPWVRFSVSDTGIGLSPDQITRLFRPFTQAAHDTTRKYGGTGLGLAISKRLVEMMGGTIGVESELGAGSTFYFSLPLRASDDALSTASTTAPRMVRIKGQRVLIVDDNASAREILSDMVTSFGMQAEAVASGVQALEVLEAAAERGAPFNIVLMDWRMPVMDGLETARRIRENRRLSEVPAVLMVTAYGREEVTRRAEQLGLQGVLIKPLTESVMFNTLVDILIPTDPEPQEHDDTTISTAARYAALTGKRVLVVDDNAFNREVATDFLAAVGVIADTAVDGVDALDKIASGQYDAVLMDTHMPRMDGLAAARELRRQPRWRDLPIISLTAQARAEDQEAARQAGMTAYLTKPIDEIALYRTLLEVMRLAPPMDATPAEVTAQPSVDVGDLRLDEARQRLRGPASAARLLGGFVRDFGDAPQRLREYLTARNLDALTTLVHSVKGSASYFTSATFFAAGDELEQSARAGDWSAIARQLPDYADRLARLLDATRAAVATLQPTDTNSATTFSARDVLEQINLAMPLVERGDFSAVKVLERLRNDLKGTPHECLIVRAQEHFDELSLEAATSTLARLAESVDKSIDGTVYG
jgi:two-component system sensor histidine kinase/response regulator